MKIGIVAQPFDRFPPLDGASIAVWAHEMSVRLMADHEVAIYCGRQSDGVRKQADARAPVTLRRVPKRLDDRFYSLARQLEWRQCSLT